jgi:hypothetical protein
MRFAEEPPPTSLLWRLMARFYVRFRFGPDEVAAFSDAADTPPATALASVVTADTFRDDL